MPHQRNLPVVPICRGLAQLISPPNQWLPSACLVPHRGAARDRHGRWEWDAMDAHRRARFSCATSGVCADGEVVWSWRSDAGAKVVKTLPASCGRRWQPSMVTEESTKDTVKTIVQGMPAVAVYPWLLTPVLFAAQAASGATRIRHSLRPLMISRAVRFNNSDISCRENADSHPLDRHAPLQAGHPVRDRKSVVVGKECRS